MQIVQIITFLILFFFNILTGYIFHFAVCSILILIRYSIDNVSYVNKIPYDCHILQPYNVRSDKGKRPTASSLPTHTKPIKIHRYTHTLTCMNKPNTIKIPHFMQVHSEAIPENKSFNFPEFFAKGSSVSSVQKTMSIESEIRQEYAQQVVDEGDRLVVVVVKGYSRCRIVGIQIYGMVAKKERK